MVASMEIRIDPHTLQRAQERGANAGEIRDVILNGVTQPAREGRLRRVQVYRYERDRLGRFYPHKRVEVIYVIEAEVAVTVTVYVFYGEWESADADPVRQQD